MKAWTFFIETYGCKVNQYESQQLREAWTAAGGLEVFSLAKADYILINSCAITSKAERDARNAINRAKKAAPCSKIILCGCAAQFYNNFQPRKKANFSLPDFCIPQKSKAEIFKGPPDKNELQEKIPCINGFYRGRPIIKVQDGCNQNCAFCIVPQTRSKLTSRDKDEIYEECAALGKQGFGELIISGVNLRLYHNEGNFWRLISWLDKKLYAEFGKKLRLRISSIDPALLTETALDVLAGSALVCPQLHISLQHASQKILVQMRRGHYDPDKINQFIKKLATIWPVMGLGADILVGFPGESNEDFTGLKSFIDILPLTYAHVFPYSRRPGTIASHAKNQVIKSEKERRAREIREQIAQKKQTFLQDQLNLPQMRLACDLHQDDKPMIYRGVNEYYVSCFIKNNGEKSEKGLITVKPVKLQTEGLEVERI